MMLRNQLLHLLTLLLINQIRDLLELLQTQDPVLHLDHPIILKIQDKVPLLNHPIALQTNQIKAKILIPKIQIRVHQKDKVQMKPTNKKN
jgi:hypothetical protein